MSEITAIRLPVGEGGALVTFKVTPQDHEMGFRLYTQGKPITCYGCKEPLSRQDARVGLRGHHSVCLACALASKMVDRSDGK